MSNAKNPKLNEQRRERYDSDPDYAEGIRTTRRERYRQSRGVNIRDSKATAAEVRAAGTRRVMAGGESEITISSEELATLMGYHYLTVIRWQNGGIFPRPSHPTERREDIRMYSVAEARALTHIMAEHQRTHQGLYTRDVTTISRLFAAIA